MMPNPRRRQAGQGLALWLLLSQMASFGFSNIPPVTLITIVSQVALHLGFLDKYWSPSIGSICVSALRVWYQDEWKRLLYATFFHADDWHLYYNMVSMLWKGSKLERRMGSLYFALLIALFSVLVNIVLVALSVLAEALLHNSSYVTQCAVGFSGVLFALKVIKNYSDPPGTEYVMGVLPVPTKIVCWAELFIIHLLVPNSSFLGHLAGILVGLGYALGPLRWILDTVYSLIMSTTAGPSYTYYRGSTGWGSEGHRVGSGARWRGAESQPRDGSANGLYNTYTGGLSEEEQFQRAQQESLNEYYGTSSTGGLSMPQPEFYQSHSSAHQMPLDIDTLRARRFNRFSQT